jgi:hypothetical protein
MIGFPLVFIRVFGRVLCRNYFLAISNNAMRHVSQ